MLLVPSPRYCEISFVFPFHSRTAPMPAGPGLPKHEPSVWIRSVSAAAAFAFAAGLRGARGRLRGVSAAPSPRFPALFEAASAAGSRSETSETFAL
jgi:hypothetical protein